MSTNISTQWSQLPQRGMLGHKQKLRDMVTVEVRTPLVAASGHVTVKTPVTEVKEASENFNAGLEPIQYASPSADVQEVWLLHDAQAPSSVNSYERHSGDCEHEQ